MKLAQQNGDWDNFGGSRTIELSGCLVVYSELGITSKPLKPEEPLL